MSPNDGVNPGIAMPMQPQPTQQPAMQQPAPQAAPVPAAQAAPAPAADAGMQATAGMTLAMLGGIDMDQVEALDRFQRFPQCSAVFQVVAASLGAIGAQHQGVMIKCRCVHLIGDPTGQLKPEDVIGKDYDDNHFISKDDGTEETQEAMLREIGFIKKALLDIGIQASGRFADVIQFVGSSGAMFTASIVHSENQKTGKTYVNMNDRAPHTAQGQQG